MIKKLAVFSKNVKEYEKARSLYLEDVFILLKLYIDNKQSLILDLGCGTGISTRQVAKLGKVIGCDPDLIMLQAARKHSLKNIRYVKGFAHKLPFKDSSFDIVTAFSSFHWFDDKKSIKEIKRVLKPGGVFYVVNKQGIKSWGDGYRSEIIKTIGQPVAKFKGLTYKPKITLKQNGFIKVFGRSWKQSEVFSVAKAVEYVQTISIWNSVPDGLKPKAVEGLKKYFTTMLKRKGKIERRLSVNVVVGIKPH